jgi:hypothetical protein
MSTILNAEALAQYSSLEEVLARYKPNSRSTLQRAAKEGRFPASHIVNGKACWLTADLDAYDARVVAAMQLNDARLLDRLVELHAKREPLPATVARGGRGLPTQTWLESLRYDRRPATAREIGLLGLRHDAPLCEVALSLAGRIAEAAKQ